MLLVPIEFHLLYGMAFHDVNIFPIGGVMIFFASNAWVTKFYFDIFSVGQEIFS